MTTKTKTTADPSGALTEVARSFRAPEAGLAAAMLRAAGIRAEVFDLHSHVMMANHAVAFGGLRVMVPESDLADAARLLDNVPQAASRPPPLLAAIFIFLVWWCGAAPVPGGLFLRRPDAGQAAGPP